MRLAPLSVIYLIYFSLFFVLDFSGFKRNRIGVEIQVLDVGQGDSIIIKTSRGRLIVIDGGDGWDVDSHLPPGLPGSLCVIDLMIQTHDHKDHSYGLKRLYERCRVLQYWSNPGVFKGKETVVDGVGIKVLWPPQGVSFADINNTSIITLITYRSFKGLFTGDADGEIICSLKELPEKLSVLKVSHHGSITGLCEEVIPETAVISVGEGNKFDHPSGQVLRFYEENGVKIHRTDKDGTYKLLIPL